MKINNKVILLVALFVLIVVGFFIFNNSPETGSISTSEAVWLNSELKDVRTGETFKISDFKGKKVLVESFAVWCPTCTKQQRNLKALHEEIGDSVISISLDTDPNEDEARIKTHIESNGFDWLYAVAPIEMTMALIDDFGTGIVSAPSSPMILVCEDGSFRKLGGFGARSVEKLKGEIARGCS